VNGRIIIKLGEVLRAFHPPPDPPEPVPTQAGSREGEKFR
jgi:hypothetical protein